MKIHRALKKIAGLAVAMTVPAFAAVAEQSGVGHYNPGQTADFIDALPGYPSFACVNIFTFYDGSAGGSQRLPIGARVALNVEATSYTNSVVLLWETPLKVLGGYYTILASVPYTWLTVSGNVEAGAKTARTEDSVNGVGDIYFSPAAIGWSIGDFKP